MNIPEDIEILDDLELTEEELRAQRRERSLLFAAGRWKVFRLDENNIVATKGDLSDASKFNYYPDLVSAVHCVLKRTTEDAVRGEAQNWLAAFEKMQNKILEAVGLQADQALAELEDASLEPENALEDTLTVEDDLDTLLEC